MHLLQALYIPPHRMVKILTLLACVGALGVATPASAQTVTSRPDASPFLHDGLTRETVQQLYDESDVQPPVGFEPQARGGLARFHLLAAAASSAGGSGGAAPSDEQAQSAELAKKL
jgi:hypothetical protein